MLKRLALDVIGQLEDDVEANPLDYLKWNRLIKQVTIKDKEEQVRSVFTRYLGIFKFDGSQWSNYINYELNRGEFQRVEQLFQECFLITDSVELCRLYVSYVRRVNDVITGGERARGIVIQAFEFAIGKVGIDVASGQLWRDYLDFLKSWTPSASWEQQQKTDLIRKVYKKFLVIPTEEIEKSWQEYIKWENDTNPITANKFISDKSAEFMLARSWNVEWNNIIQKQLRRDIHANTIADPNVKKQLNLWLQWVEFEKKNLLELRELDQLEKRVSYAFRQATISLPFVPELWFKFNKYWLLSNEEANISRCIELLQSGLIMNPKSLLLTFQLTELYEKDNSFEKSKHTFEALIDILTKEHTAITNQITALEPEKKEDEIKYPTAEQHNRLQALAADEQRLVTLVTCVYVKYLVATKRQSGIKEARNVFKLRKNFLRMGYEFYTENAWLEYYSDNKKIATKIFELAMKSFGLDGDFLLLYLKYLILNNDVDNIRKLLQTADSNFAKEIASIEESFIMHGDNMPTYIRSAKEKEITKMRSVLQKLFKVYVSYASDYLSLDVAHSFTTKYEQLFPDHDPIELFTDRYRIGGLNVIKEYELDAGEKDDEDDEPKLKKVKPNPAPEQAPVVQNTALNSLFSQVEETETEEQNIVGQTIVTLMNTLPNASYFGERTFDSRKLVEMLAAMEC